jgi:hypothetical protein
MFRLLPLVLVAGCLNSTYDIDVTWTTQGDSQYPDEELGARISYDAASSIWVPGHSSSARVAVDTSNDTTEICVTLQRRTFELVERFGHTVLEEVYTDLSDRECQDVVLDSDNPRADFTLVPAE